MRLESASAYNTPARLFHWITALLLLVQYVLAWTMPDVHRDTKPVGLIAWHLGVGVAIVLLVFVRLLWRSMHAAPPEPASLPAALRALGRYTHWLLYNVPTGTTEVKIKLDFVRPFEGTSDVEMKVEPVGDQTKLTWSMAGKNNFIAKAIGLVVDCEKMCGDQFEQGLSNMKKVVESPAPTTDAAKPSDT